jgi:hypothetical protein
VCPEANGSDRISFHVVATRHLAPDDLPGTIEGDGVVEAVASMIDSERKSVSDNMSGGGGEFRM